MMLLRRRAPVLDQGNGGGLVQDSVDQEPAVARDIVLQSRGIRSTAEDQRLKQRDGGAGLERFARDRMRSAYGRA